MAVAALAAVVALFVVFAGGDDDGTDSASPQPQSPQGSAGGQPPDSATTQPQSARGATEDQSPEQQTATIERIVVRGGKPVGGVKRLEYESGERVRFSVRSDVADEVHVHGFDIRKDVRAGGSVRFGFAADIEGVFEVELEDSKIEIAGLRIAP
jgi:hypothetical protein